MNFAQTGNRLCLLTQVHVFITGSVAYLNRATTLHVPQPYLNRTNSIFTPYYKRSYGTLLRKLLLPHTVYLVVEFAVDTVALLVDQLEGVAAVAVHVPEAIGDAPVTKEERDLVRGLRPEGDEVPKHVHVLRIHRGGGGERGWGCIWCGAYKRVYTVEPPLKETPNKGQDSEHQNVTFL